MDSRQSVASTYDQQPKIAIRAKMQKAQKLLEGVTKYVLKSLANEAYPTEKIYMIAEGITLFCPFDQPPQSWADFQELLLRSDIQDTLFSIDPEALSPAVVGRLHQLCTRFEYWHEDTTLPRHAHSVKNFLIAVDDAVQFGQNRALRKPSPSKIKRAMGGRQRFSSIDSSQALSDTSSDVGVPSPSNRNLTRVASPHRRPMSAGGSSNSPLDPASFDSYIVASQTKFRPKSAAERIIDREKDEGLVNGDEEPASYTTAWLRQESSGQQQPSPARASSPSTTTTLAALANSPHSGSKPILRRHDSSLSARSEMSARSISFAPDTMRPLSPDSPPSPSHGRSNSALSRSPSGAKTTASFALRNQSPLHRSASQPSVSVPATTSPLQRSPSFNTSNADRSSMISSSTRAVDTTEKIARAVEPSTLLLEEVQANAARSMFMDAESQSRFGSKATPPSYAKVPGTSFEQHVNPVAKRNVQRYGNVVPSFQDLVQMIERVREERNIAGLKFASMVGTVSEEQERINSILNAQPVLDTFDGRRVVDDMLKLPQDAARIQKSIVEAKNRAAGLSPASSSRSLNSARAVSQSPKAAASPQSPQAAVHKRGFSNEQSQSSASKSNNTPPRDAQLAAMSAELESLRIRLMQSEQEKRELLRASQR